MKLAAALILAACTVAASAALEPLGEFTVTMNPAQQAMCKAQGGCVILTQRAIRDLTEQACPKGTGI